MMNKEMSNRIARYCATSGAQNTTDGRWSITYDELSHHFGVDKNDINGNAQLLADALNQQEEINDLMMTEDCIEMTYHMEHCPLCRQGGIEGALTLTSVIGCNITDEHESQYRPIKYDGIAVKLAKHTLWLFENGGEQAVFSHCEIDDQNFIARDFPNVIFDHCRFNCVDFSEADLSHSVFESCDFVDCDLSYVSATGADFSGTDFGDSNLFEADFDTCNFKDAKLNLTRGMPRLQFCCIEDADLDADNSAVTLNECHENEDEWIAERDGTTMGMQV